MFGCTLVKKLRSILLMEADFNFANKEIYGIRMMDNVRKYGFMAEEIFSEKGRWRMTAHWLRHVSVVSVV